MFILYIPAIFSVAANDIVAIGRQRLIKNRKEKNVVDLGGLAGCEDNADILILRERQVSE